MYPIYPNASTEGRFIPQLQDIVDWITNKLDDYFLPTADKYGIHNYAAICPIATLCAERGWDHPAVGDSVRELDLPIWGLLPENVMWFRKSFDSGKSRAGVIVYSKAHVLQALAVMKDFTYPKNSL